MTSLQPVPVVKRKRSTHEFVRNALTQQVTEARTSSAAAAEEEELMRREHVRLIRDLLIAINFPEKARAKVKQENEKSMRLPPIRTNHRAMMEDGEITPSANSVGEGSDKGKKEEVESDRNSTPTPPGRPTLPTLKQLLNDLPEGSRPMREREMECDV